VRRLQVNWKEFVVRAEYLSRADVIEGVQCRPLKMNHDSRGCFTEVFSQNWGLPMEPVQWSVVTSQPKVLRGIYLHLRHDEYILVIRGRACVGLYDLRPDSQTMGTSFANRTRWQKPLVLAISARNFARVL